MSSSTDIDTGLPGAKDNEVPDIGLIPSFEKYEARVERLSKTHPFHDTTLPPGFPKNFEAQRTWVGSDFVNEIDYVYQLSETEIGEIEAALLYFQQVNPQYKDVNQQLSQLDPLGNDFFDQVSKQTFPLPTLGGKLEDLSKELHFGRGFAILRGLEPKKYSFLETIVIYTGVTSYVAEGRGCQDEFGNMIIHVKDVGDEVAPPDERQSLYNHTAQPFHSDSCDVLAFYVISGAFDGGESKIASTATVYNHITATRPDVIKTLADDSWVFEEHNINRETAEVPLWYKRPILFNQETHGPFFCFSRRALTGSLGRPRSLNIPPISEAQAEALDMVHFTATENSLSIQLKPGDIQFLNNFAVFHAREAFTDNLEQKRHMLRLWLRNGTHAWETPECLKETWDAIYGDSERRKKAHWRIDPSTIEREHVVRTYTCG